MVSGSASDSTRPSWRKSRGPDREVGPVEKDRTFKLPLFYRFSIGHPRSLRGRSANRLWVRQKTGPRSPVQMYNTAWEVHKPRSLHIASYRKLKRPAAGGRAGRSARTVGSQSFLSIRKAQRGRMGQPVPAQSHHGRGPALLHSGSRDRAHCAPSGFSGGVSAAAWAHAPHAIHGHVSRRGSARLRPLAIHPLRSSESSSTVSEHCAAAP
jgi:hypothetical protein